MVITWQYVLDFIFSLKRITDLKPNTRQGGRHSLIESRLARGRMETRSNRDKLPSSADTRPWSFCWHQDLGSHLSPWMVNRDVGAWSIAEGRQGHWGALSCCLKRREAPGRIMQIKTVSRKPRIEPPRLEKPCLSLHLPPFKVTCPTLQRPLWRLTSYQPDMN